MSTLLQIKMDVCRFPFFVLHITQTCDVFLSFRHGSQTTSNAELAQEWKVSGTWQCRPRLKHDHSDYSKTRKDWNKSVNDMSLCTCMAQFSFMRTAACLLRLAKMMVRGGGKGGGGLQGEGCMRDCRKELFRLLSVNQLGIKQCHLV